MAVTTTIFQSLTVFEGNHGHQWYSWQSLLYFIIIDIEKPFHILFIRWTRMIDYQMRNSNQVAWKRQLFHIIEDNVYWLVVSTSFQ